MDDLSYWLALHLAPGIGPATLHQLFSHCSQAEHFFHDHSLLTPLELSPIQRKSLLQALKNPHWQAVEQTLRWAETDENHIIQLKQEQYPRLLRQIHAAPLILFVKGRVEILNCIQLAMVGSRNPSADGAEIAYRFAHFLSDQGMVITSGMALGIDAQSHYGALQGKAKSIAVAGTGLDRIYPAAHKELAWQLVEQGAIISEYPLGTGPMKQNFPQRNRLISGLSVGTLVVEAALKSGSLITAQTALEQAREVFAIPGSIHNPLARGCHQLIRAGAKLVETAEDIQEELMPLMLAAHTDKSNTSFAPDPLAEQTKNNISLLPKIQQKILKHIAFTPVSNERIIERCALNAADVNANLVLLELEDYIQSHPGGMFSRKTC